jgi:hypothetical protein
MGRVHASRNVRELALFRNPAEALKLASFRNHAATTPSQDWLRFAISLPQTRRRLRARIGFVPQLRIRGPSGGSRPELASFRNYASAGPVAGCSPTAAFPASWPRTLEELEVSRRQHPRDIMYLLRRA